MKRTLVIPPPGKHLPDPHRFKFQLLCILGLTLALAVLGALLFLTFYAHRPDATGGSFSGELKKFDALLRETANPDPARFNAPLDRLEKKAIGVESRLSILKRRRSLVRLSAGDNRDRFQITYREAAIRAAEAFPFSEPLAAIAAESLISDLPGRLSAAYNEVPRTENSPAKTGVGNSTGKPPAETGPGSSTGNSPAKTGPGSFEELRNQLEQYGGLLSESRFLPLALDIQVLLGALSDPETTLSRGAEILAIGAASSTGPERESFLINGALYRLLHGDREGALSQVVSLLQSPELPAKLPAEAGDQSLRFGAEFFYDMNNPLRAAELFSRFSDTPSMGRLADSLWLAGFRDGAAEIWAALVSPPVSAAGETAGSPVTGPQPAGVETPLKVRSLYNLARVSVDKQKQADYFHGLFSEAPGHMYGVIGYSRLFDTPRAEALLTEMDAGQEPLLDLELVRRRLGGWEFRRVTAEIWLLLGRHPDAEALYQWGAWYFDRQRQYPETALLLRQARLNGMDGPWLALHDTLRLIREGRLDEATALLQEQQQSGKIWQIPANLGIIMESRRSLAAALDYYETASSLVRDPKDAARVQLRIAHCLHMMGRDQDSRRVLEYVQDLDPDNLNARLELRRLSL